MSFNIRKIMTKYKISSKAEIKRYIIVQKMFVRRLKWERITERKLPCIHPKSEFTCFHVH